MADTTVSAMHLRLIRRIPDVSSKARFLRMPIWRVPSYMSAWRQISALTEDTLGARMEFDDVE